MNPPGETRGGRVDAFDFVKGVLVVCMVIYHSLNHSSRYELGFQWLYFLPPSFVIITGVLISQVYFTRPVTSDAATRRRLVARGVKLIALFTALNLLGNLVMRRNWNGQPLGVRQFFDYWFEIFVEGDGRLAAFEVLLPIGYLLLLGPAWLWLARGHKALLPVVCATWVTACAVLDQVGWLRSVGALMGAGLLGVWVGRVAPSTLGMIARWWPAAAAAYVVHAVVMRSLGGSSFLLQVSGSLLALTFLFGLGRSGCVRGWGNVWLLKMGRYSLLSYIAQIAVLQVLARQIHKPEPLSVEWLVLFFLALLLTSGVVELADRLRSRFAKVDACYRLVFA
jgi:hypothetical protein